MISASSSAPIGISASATISVNARSEASSSAPRHSASVNASHGSSISSASRRRREHLLEAVERERVEQRLLGREVAVDGADADARAAGDVVHLRVAAVLGEDRSRRLQDPLAIAPGVGAERA